MPLGHEEAKQGAPNILEDLGKGDPTSPFFFILVAYLVSSLVVKERNWGRYVDLELRGMRWAPLLGPFTSKCGVVGNGWDTEVAFALSF